MVFYFNNYVSVLMKRWFFIIFSPILIVAITFQTALSQRISIDRKQATQAYEFLNTVRERPEQFSKELGLTTLNKVNRSPLVWNRILAKVAEQRALDMAKRNYFNHINPDGNGPNILIYKAGYDLNSEWLKDRSANYFESIGANHETAVDGMKSLMRGKRENNYAHRRHLLGMDEWNSSLYDVGIAFVHAGKNSRYKTYLVVLIAKHDW